MSTQLQLLGLASAMLAQALKENTKAAYDEASRQMRTLRLNNMYYVGDFMDSLMLEVACMEQESKEATQQKVFKATLKQFQSMQQEAENVASV